MSEIRDQMSDFRFYKLLKYFKFFGSFFYNNMFLNTDLPAERPPDQSIQAGSQAGYTEFSQSYSELILRYSALSTLSHLDEGLRDSFSYSAV
jgi:hypothetical protein